MGECQEYPGPFHDVVAGNCRRQLSPAILRGYREGSDPAAISKSTGSLPERRTIGPGTTSVTDPDAAREQSSPQSILNHSTKWKFTNENRGRSPLSTSDFPGSRL